MEIKVLLLTRSQKPTVLASVRIELAVENSGDSITTDDARVLRNKQGQLWVAMLSYSVPAAVRRGYDYSPAILLSVPLKRAVEDAVLLAYETWAREQDGDR
jgi:hypothetical protein